MQSRRLVLMLVVVLQSIDFERKDINVVFLRNLVSSELLYCRTLLRVITRFDWSNTAYRLGNALRVFKLNCNIFDITSVMCCFPRQTNFNVFHQNKPIVYDEPINNIVMLIIYHKRHASPNPRVKNSHKPHWSWTCKQKHCHPSWIWLGWARLHYHERW